MVGSKPRPQMVLTWSGLKLGKFSAAALCVKNSGIQNLKRENIVDMYTASPPCGTL